MQALATHAQLDHRQHLQPFQRDVYVTPLTPPIAAAVDPDQGCVDVGQYGDSRCPQGDVHLLVRFVDRRAGLDRRDAKLFDLVDAKPSLLLKICAERAEVNSELTAPHRPRGMSERGHLSSPSSAERVGRPPDSPPAIEGGTRPVPGYPMVVGACLTMPGRRLDE
jgi:hypothetical protein